MKIWNDKYWEVLKKHDETQFFSRKKPMINLPRNTWVSRCRIFPDKTAHEFAFERRDYPWQASVFIRNVATFVDRNRSHRWKMRLKSNSPAQPSGGDVSDGDAGVSTWDGTLRITSGWRNFDFLGRRCLHSPTFRFRLFDFKPRHGDPCDPSSTISSQLLPPISYRGLCEKTLLYEISCFFHRLPLRRYFPVFWHDHNPEEFCRSERFNKRGNKKFMLKFYDTQKLHLKNL